MAQSVARQWPALPDATPESLALWARQITRLLQEGAIANGDSLSAFLTPAAGDAAYVNVTGDTMTGQLINERSDVTLANVILRALDDGAATGPVFVLDRQSASPAAADLIGQIRFRGRDSAGNVTDYGYIQARIDDPANGSEDVTLLVGRLVAGADVSAELVSKATAAQVRAATVGPHAVTADLLASASALVGLTETAGAVAVDWNTFINGIVTVDQNTVISNPTNGQPGTWRSIIVAGNDATDRIITFGTQYQGELPVITDADSGRFYLLMIYCLTTTHFAVSAKRVLG